MHPPTTKAFHRNLLVLPVELCYKTPHRTVRGPAATVSDVEPKKKTVFFRGCALLFEKGFSFEASQVFFGINFSGCSFLVCLVRVSDWLGFEGCDPWVLNLKTTEGQ